MSSLTHDLRVARHHDDAASDAVVVRVGVLDRALVSIRDLMGVILAGDASGESLGTAPGATWMAARVFGPITPSAVPAL